MRERALRLRRATTRWVWATAIVASLVVLDHHRVSIHPGAEHHGTECSAEGDRSAQGHLAAAHSSHEIPELSVGANAGVSLDPQLSDIGCSALPPWCCLLTASAVQLFWRERGWGRATLGGASVYVAPGVGPAVVGLIRPRIVVPRG